MSKKNKPRDSIKQSVTARASKGEKPFHSGDYTQAIGIWELIPVGLRPASALAEAYFRRGLERFYGPHADPDAGLKDLEQAVVYQPNDPCYAYHLGLAAFHQGALEQAVRSYRAARQVKGPFFRRAAYPLAVALFQQGLDPDTDPVWGDLTAEERARLLAAAAFRRRPYRLPAEASAVWRGLVALAAGEREVVQSTSQEILSVAGTAVEKSLASYYLGTLAAQDEDWEAARHAWAAAVKAGLRSARLRSNLAEICHRLAEKWLLKGDLPAAQNAAQYAVGYSTGAEARSTSALNELLSQIHQRIAYQAAHDNQWEKAQAHWQIAAEIENSSFRLEYNLALAYEHGGDYLDAGGAWREALRRRPRRADHPDAMSDEQVARIWQRAAEAYQKAGETAEAIRVYQQAIKWNPENIPVRLALAAVQLSEGRAQAATNELNHILEQDPDNITALLRMGEVLFNSDRWWNKSGALRYWERVMQLQPGNPHAIQGLADYYRDQAEIDLSWDRFSQAIVNYQKSLEYQPGDAQTLAEIANCYIHLGDPSNAQGWIQKALDRGAQNLDVYNSILEALLSMEQFEPAWKLIEQAEARVASIPGAFYVAQAINCLEEQHRDQALLWLERAVARALPDEPILVLIGEALVHQKDKLAQQYLERAIAAGQLPGQAHLMLAILANMQQNQKEARRQLKEAERIARQTHDEELIERVEMARMMIDGPLGFLGGLIKSSGMPAIEDILASLLEELEDE